MKRIAALIMGFVLMTVLVAPASAKELVVAHDTNFMPFEFKGPDGKFTGFDIELWETIAKKLGLSYKFQPMDFNGIIPGLQSGQVDVGIAGMTIKPERAEVVDFSDPYFDAQQALLVRKGSGIRSLDDLRGAEPAVNAQALRDLLDGRRNAYRDIVLLNAAAAFLVGGKVETLRDGVELGAAVIDDGRARAALDALVEATRP